MMKRRAFIYCYVLDNLYFMDLNLDGLACSGIPEFVAIPVVEFSREGYKIRKVFG
jgi:hypothetical protein